MDSFTGADGGRGRVGTQNNGRPVPVGTLGALSAVTQARRPKKMSAEPRLEGGRNHSLQNRGRKATGASG